MSFLVDTDICSAHLKGSPRVTHRFLQYTGRLHVSVVSIGELYTWALRSSAPPARLTALQELCAGLSLLSVNERVARKFGELNALLLDTGRPVAGMDLLIAATALSHDLSVVTHNVQDFACVPGLSVLDWLGES